MVSVPALRARSPILAGALVQFLVLVYPMVNLELSGALAFAGLLGGGVAGVLTGRYGKPLHNGIFAAAAAGTAACLVVAGYGSALSYLGGFGLDSRLAAQYGFRGFFIFLLVVPLQAIAGGFAGVAGNHIRTRALDRRAGA